MLKQCLNCFRMADSVTRWLDYYFNIWLLTTVNICPNEYKMAKEGSKFSQGLNKPSKNFQRLYFCCQNFAKSGHTELVDSKNRVWPCSLKNVFI